MKQVKGNRVLPREHINHSNTLSNNTREDFARGHHQMVNTEIRLIVFFAAKDEEVLYSQQKTRPGADCGSDHERLTGKFRLKLKKVGKTTRPFRYDLNVVLVSGKYISIKKKRQTCQKHCDIGITTDTWTNGVESRPQK